MSALRVQILVGGIDRAELPEVVDVFACAEAIDVRSVQEGRYDIATKWGDPITADNATRELVRRLAQYRQEQEA